MFENLAVFDIGSSSIKCIKAKTGFKNFQIESLIIEKLDFSVEDKFNRIEIAIDKIISNNDFTDYTIITTLPSNKLFYYSLNFPFNNIEQISEVIHYEIADCIPLDIESVIYDFQPVEIKTLNGMDVIAVVSQKSLINRLIDLFSKYNLAITFIGSEHNALFHSYVYFNTVQDESVVQLNIGYEKSIINLVINNELIATRCLLFGVKNLVQHFEKYKPENVALQEIFSYLSFDFSSIENNIHFELPKKLNITQQKFKSLFNELQEEINNLIHEVVLFLNVEINKSANITIQRIIISGGGAAIAGLSSLISQNLQIPVVMQALINQTNETELQSQFFIAFGTLINYIHRNKHKTIDFLKDEFGTSLKLKSKKNFYIAFFYGSLSIIFFIILIIILLVNHVSTSSYFKTILEERYKRYFLTTIIPDDPIKEATNKYTMVKREVDSIESFLKIEEKMIDILYLLISNFPYDANFDLNNLVINESIIRLDGSINSIAKIDEFKNRLTQTQKFDSIVFNTNVMQNNVKFSMTIKLKSGKPKKADVAEE